MKTSYMVPLLLALVAGASVKGDTSSHQSKSATLPAPTAYRVATHDANSRVWQRETYELGAKGQVVTRVHKYTELCSGLYYQDAKGHWQESQEQIESYPAGAIARQGPYQVIFANNLNSEGAVDVQTVDCKRLRSNILGLAYYDSASGKSVVIGEIQDCQGELISSNQVLYPHAFSSVNADVRYTYKRGSFEQDVILREQPPAPEAYGMNSETAELEVITEFVNPPTARVVAERSGEASDDQVISWGGTSLGKGKAFSLQGKSVSAPVSKRYIEAGGRHFLLEKVRLPDIQPALSKLPEQAANVKRLPGMASSHLAFPEAPTAKPAAQPMRLAMGTLPDNGYVLDYTTVNGTVTDCTFQGDTTYYLSSTITLNGVITFEGGAVLKYDSGASLVFDGAINWLGSAYRPVVLTAKDDNSVGETISGSTGNPTGYYASSALTFNGDSTLLSSDISNFRISYAQTAIGENSGNFNLTFRDGQIVNCGGGLAVYSGITTLQNILLSAMTGITGWSNAAVYARNCTVCGSSTLFNAFDRASCSASFTNCVFANVTSLYGINVSGDYNGVYNSYSYVNKVGNKVPFGVGSSQISSSDYPFQTVGGGSFYLAANSPFHNAGTANIDPGSLADLAQRTTYPPVVYAGTSIATPTTLGPQAVRDNSGTPDLGYHYDPLDYVFGNSAEAAGNLTFTAGTAVGYYYGSGGGSYALMLDDNVTASFNGTPAAPCRWARYNTVQEGNGSWTPQSWLGGITGNSYSTAAPAVQMAFTKCYELASQGNFLRDSGALIVLLASDSEFYSGNVGGYSASYNLTNCLFVNSWVGLWENHDAANLAMQNCTMIRGHLFADNTSGGAWPVTIVNSAFDSTAFYMNAHGGTTDGYYSDYNAFLVNANQTASLGGHEVFVNGSYNWQVSWLGNYYLPASSPVIDKGSTTADNEELQQFTTQTSQTKEGNSQVDIGYHYVATDASGNPVDYQVPWVVGPNNVSVIYGNDAVLTVTVTGATQPVHYQWQRNVGGTFQNIGTDSASCTVSKPAVADSGSQFQVVVTSGSSSYTSPAATLTVNPAALSITANNQSKMYGQTVSFGSGSTQFASSGLQNSETIGTVTLACSGGAAGAGVAGSPYAITPSAATGGTFNPANYTITYNPGTLTVNKGALSITANNQTKTYGQTVSFGSGSTQFASSGLQNSETIGTVTLACGGGMAGAGVAGSPYAITPSAATGGTFNPANYTITYNPGTLTVNKGALSITANNQTKTYGQTVSFGSGSTQFASSGLQNSETIGTVTLACGGGMAGAGVAGSPYAITPSAATGGTFNPANYTITYNPGTLMVTPAALSITANGQGKKYGQTVTFGGSSTQFASSGLQNGETIGTVVLACNGGAATAGAGTYPITPSAATGGTFNPANYSINYVNGILTVGKANLTVAANNQIMGYGQSIPTLTYTLSGFVNGDPASVVGGTANVSTTGTSSSPAGTYEITVTQGSLNAANYAFVMQNGTLTIESIVNFSVSQATASEFGLVSGSLTVARTDTGAALVVTYNSTGGSAKAGTDYTALPGTVTIPAGQSSATVSITPLLNPNGGVATVTVVLALQSGANYLLGSSSTTGTCNIVPAYGNSDGDGLADALAAAFGCNPQVSNTGWNAEDAALDGLPATYQTLVGSADNPAPGLPSYSTCPLP